MNTLVIIKVDSTNTKTYLNRDNKEKINKEGKNS